MLRRTLTLGLMLLSFAGLCACGFIIGTFIAFAQKPWELFGVPLMGLFGIATTWFLFSTAVVRQLWGSFKKVSLGRLLKK